MDGGEGGLLDGEHTAVVVDDGAGEGVEQFEDSCGGGWGWTVAAALDNRLTRRLGLADGPPTWLLWELDVQKGTGTNQLRHTVVLAPFLGVVGMPPDEPGESSTIPSTQPSTIARRSSSYTSADRLGAADVCIPRIEVIA